MGVREEFSFFVVLYKGYIGMKLPYSLLTTSKVEEEGNPKQVLRPERKRYLASKTRDCDVM